MIIQCMPSPATSLEAVKGIAQRPLFTSLGLAIIDEIQFGLGKIVKNVLGRSATYCESMSTAPLFDCSGPSNRQKVPLYCYFCAS